MRGFQFSPLWVLIALSMVATNGCASLSRRDVPRDFMFLLHADVPSQEGQAAQNVFIRINSRGQGHFERYNTGGIVRYDESGMVAYEREQVVDTGDFKLRGQQVKRLWQAIRDNNFFQLKGDYLREFDTYYAFLVIEANGQTHKVDNVGVEVPEIGVILDRLRSMLPLDVAICYGDCAK